MTTIGALFLLLGVVGQAQALIVEIDTTEAGCAGISTVGVACEVPAGARPVTVTWRFDQAVGALNAYDFAVRWDPDELSLLSSSPIFPDGGTPEPFLEAPSDPTSSNAVALSIVALPTTQLFSVTFLMTPDTQDGEPDLEWFANGQGLSPGSLGLGNPAGATIEFWRAGLEVPVLSVAPGLLPGLLVLTGAAWIVRGRRG